MHSPSGATTEDEPELPVPPSVARPRRKLMIGSAAVEMLPRRLSQDLCSLHSGVDRLAFSVFWEMDAAANVLGAPRFAKTVIRSAASLTYAEAQARIDELESALRDANSGRASVNHHYG